MGSSRTPDEEPVHDVLAADEFALPAPDPALRHRPFVAPDDPSGIAEPHDVLAAEEFAMPAAGAAPVRATRRRRWSRFAAGIVLALAALRRRRR